MKEYVKSLLPRLRQLNLRADAMAMVANKPWKIVREDGKKEQLVFRQNGDLLMISGGQLVDAKWDVIPEIGALMLNVEGKKSLYNSAFVDGSILLLKDYDGPSGTILVNSDEVPEGEELWHVVSVAGAPIVNDHLSSGGSAAVAEESSRETFRMYPLEMFTNGLHVQLIDGRILRSEYKEAFCRYGGHQNLVVIGGELAADDLYWESSMRRCFDVKEGHMQMTYVLDTMIPYEHGDVRLYLEAGGGDLCSGCPVALNHGPAPDGDYSTGPLTSFQVKNGRVV